tara:strand:- start:2537 stop:3055 length:519 start_codon:yes stop_codon:yes gene_type:complete
MSKQSPKKQRKRDRVKKAIKSGGKKIAKFTKSRIVQRFIPLFGLITIFVPGKAHAFTLDEGMIQFGANATFIAAEYKGMREVVRTGVSAIPDPTIRTAVSTVGSIAALVGGVSCGIGSAVCSGMGWEQKAMVCLHGVGVCSGVASGMHEADPINPVTVPGKIAGDAIGRMSP